MIRPPRAPKQPRPGRVALLAATLTLSGCAIPMTPNLNTEVAATGETVVTVSRPETLQTISQEVYGSDEFALALAARTGLGVHEKVPRGTVIVAPPLSKVRQEQQSAANAQELFERGLDQAKQGQHQDAAASFERALREAPKRPDIRYNYGLAKLRAQEPIEAVKILQEAVALRPKHAETRYALGSALRHLRTHDRALTEFEEAARLDPLHYAAKFAAGRSLEDLQRYDEARDRYRQCVKHAPTQIARSARERLEALRTQGADPAILAPE